jgi:putative lipoic acid-binding regulatory protein
MKTLVVFDYSGTLSLAAVAFGRPDRLREQLDASGLAALGIASPGVFWDEVVGPTWTEGSTTPVGYRGVMARRIRERCGVRPGDPADDRIRDAVSRFVGAYLGQSRIDLRWQPLLNALTSNPDVQLLVATDHYAEATDYIVGYLRDGGLTARAIRDEPEAPAAPARILVANSADLGAPKASRAFWEQSRRLLPARMDRVILIDDFGFNEQAGDSYGARQKVAERMAKTAFLLEEVFDGAVEVVPFMIEPGLPAGAAGAVIRETDGQVRALLSGTAGGSPSPSARQTENPAPGGSGLQPPREPPACKRKPDLTYPCPWVYKVVGADPDALRQAIAAVVGPRRHTVTPSRTSANGKYHSLNLALEVRDEAERLTLYDGLRRQPAVRIVL